MNKNIKIARELVILAKSLIAKNQGKKLLQYLVNDKYKNNTPSQNEINTLKAKINEIQKQSFNFSWFVNRFIQQKKHFQDIQDLLKVTKAYSKLNKELRTFDFNGNKSFSDFHNFMESYLNKNVKNQEFNAPAYCKLIHSDGKYNYYYANAKDKKCYRDLHKCNTKADGNQYAMWCVVTGSVQWGSYTNAEFPFYVYVTDKKNTPYMLFNFGYDQDCQIKDIHDNAFTQYDEQLLNSIKQLAKKYDFDITKNEDDFKTFNQTDELYNKQLDELNIDKDIISQSQKYNGLNFIEDNIIYDFKKNKKSYLIANNNIVNLQGYKINLYLLNLLKDKKYIDSIIHLAENDKFFLACSQQIQNFIIKVLIDEKKYDDLYSLIIFDKITDENLVKEIIQVLIDKKQHKYLYGLIFYNKIKDENQLKQIIQVLINKKDDYYLYGLIYNGKITDENQLKQSIQVVIDGGDYDNLYDLINFDKIKDENLFKQSIQVVIDKKDYDCLYGLISNNKIKDENLVKESIQVFIDEEQYKYLYDLIYSDKITDENQVKQIIQILLNNKQYKYLYFLISEDKIKDENQVKEIIQAVIDKKDYNYLYNLIYYNKVKKENQVKEIIQVIIDNKQYKYLSSLIRDDKINQSLLTQEQKELLKKEKPNLKLSKKLTKISTAKKLIKLAKTLIC